MIPISMKLTRCGTIKADKYQDLERVGQCFYKKTIFIIFKRNNMKKPFK